MIRKEKAEELKKSEQSGQLYNYLLAYCQRLKMKASIDRNLIQARLLSAKLKVETLFQQGNKHTLHNQSVRPQNIIRFYEKALKAIKSQKQQMNQDKESLDPLSLMQFEFTEKYINAQISYFVSLHYIQSQNGFKQALVVLQNCSYQIEEALELFQHELKSLQKGDKTEQMAQELRT